MHNVPTGRVFRPFFAWLARGRRNWLLIAAVLFFFVGAYALYRWRTDLHSSENISFDALTEAFEETKQSHKGLEAFVLSGLGEEMETKLDNIPVTKKFEDAFNNLQNAVRQPAGAFPELVVEQPELSKADITDKFIRNKKGGEGFLYIPGMVVGAWVPANAREGEITKKVKGVCVEVKDKEVCEEEVKNVCDEVKDKEICEELARGKVRVFRMYDGVLKNNIAVSERVAPHLNTLLQTEALSADQSVVGTPTPVQSYFLSATGLIRISRNGVPDVHAYYLKQFSPTTFFPDRPYFWGTVNDSSYHGPITPKAGLYKVGEIFRKTKPYIDLGGNGVVVTLSREIEGVGVKSGVFLDFGLGSEPVNKIKKKVESLGGFAGTTTWLVGTEVSAGPFEKPLPDGREKQLRDQLTYHLTHGTLSEIYGKIFVLVGSKEGDKKDGKVAFTVPVEPAEYKDPNVQARPTSITLLYCELDLDNFRWWVLFKPVVIAGSFAASCLFFVLWGWDYRRSLREQEKAFESFGRVMEEAPVAYCRLNERDEFIKMNKKFATLLGYESLDAAQASLVNRKTFESLLADKESRRVYEYIQGKRKNGTPTDPYRVMLRRENGKIIAVSVYGANVPKPESHLKGRPETFGIVVREDAPPEVTVRPLFHMPEQPPEPADVFVLMPFASEFDPVFESISDVARHLVPRATRADKSWASREGVMDLVWASIKAARVVVADCTGRNPNVLYEAGIAHTLGKPVILITQDKKDIPFDLMHRRYIPYEHRTGVGRKRFENDLEEALKSELNLGSK